MQPPSFSYAHGCPTASISWHILQLDMAYNQVQANGAWAEE
jgi:hypothetical protein